MQKNTYGKAGEIIAVNYLKKKGYLILVTNYTNTLGEIDIIAKDKDYIVFVEVKTRMSRAFGDPMEAVDERKQLKIMQTATMYLKSKRLLETPCRYDVIAILGDISNPEIRHIQNAF